MVSSSSTTTVSKQVMGMWSEERRSTTSTVALYALGVIVALMLALLVGALGASPAQAQTFLVNSTAHPGDGVCNATQCTLKEAIQAANNNDTGDVINFASGLKGTINLHNTATQGGFTITEGLAINGPGARVLAVNGNQETRPFVIASQTIVTIRGLTIKNGGGLPGSDPNGGDIKNSGELTLDKATLSGNRTHFSGFGGGIKNDGTLVVTNSTFSGNNAEDGSGIHNASEATLRVTNSTFSGNNGGMDCGGGLGSFSEGAGIYNNGTITVTNSTISGNIACIGGGMFNANASTANLRNTIVAGNTATDGASFGHDARGTFASQGNNLIGNISGSSGWVASDRLNINPLLGPLQNNGGPTDTRAIWPGSQAIDHAANCPATTDQRGVGRKDGDGNGSVVCDIGAYERSDFSSPKVSSTIPGAGATGVRRGVTLTATFTEKMTRSTLSKTTFKLFKVNSNGSTTQVTNVVVSSSTDGLKATLNPFGSSSTLLAANTRYRAVVTTGARDLAGNQLDQSPTQAGKQQKVWNFKTGG